MARDLTNKEKGFVKDIVKGKTGTDAVLNNYDTKDKDVAGVIASQNLGKLKIQNAIKSIAESIPDEDLIKVHTEGLQAVKMAGDSAEIDFAVRHKYLDSAYKLKGVYAPDKLVTLTITHEQTPEALQLAQKYEEELKKTL